MSGLGSRVTNYSELEIINKFSGEHGDQGHLEDESNEQQPAMTSDVQGDGAGSPHPLPGTIACKNGLFPGIL